MGNEQFGFRRRLGTRDIFGVVKIILIQERCGEIRKTLSLCFMGVEKAFDNVG